MEIEMEVKPKLILKRLCFRFLEINILEAWHTRNRTFFNIGYIRFILLEWSGKYFIEQININFYFFKASRISLKISAPKYEEKVILFIFIFFKRLQVILNLF